MSDINVTELRQNLPLYLDRARRGERFRVTSRGEVIAEISGPKAARENAEEIRRRLRGQVTHFKDPAEPSMDASEWEVNR